jgi:hypothetical protein
MARFYGLRDEDDGLRMVFSTGDAVFRDVKGEPQNWYDDMPHTAMAVSGRYLALALMKPHFHVTVYQPRSVVLNFRFTLAVQALHIAGDQLAAGGADGQVFVADLSDTQVVPRKFPQRSDGAGVLCVALCLDFLAVAYEDEYLAVYKASTEEEVFRQKVFRADVVKPGRVFEMGWNLACTALAVPGSAHLRVLEVGDWKILDLESPHVHDILSAAWAPDGCHLATACKEKCVMWDWAERAVVRQIDVQQPVVSLLWQTKATLLICDENMQTSHEVPPPEQQSRLRRAAAKRKEAPALAPGFTEDDEEDAAPAGPSASAADQLDDFLCVFGKNWRISVEFWSKFRQVLTILKVKLVRLFRLSSLV